MPLQVQGRVAWVTGASSGIGEALARKLIAEGWNVAAQARSEAPLQALANAAPDRVLPLIADVRDYEACKRAYAQIMERFGRLDAVIANAGISHRANVEEVELAVLREVMEVNFWGAVHVIKTALPEIKRRRGWIVGVSSIAGFRGLPARSGYSASKFALNGFLEALRTELYGSSVKVLIAAPGFTRSAIRLRALDAQGRPYGETPLPEEKLMSAEEVAHRIYQAMLSGKKYLLLTTQGKLTVWLHRLVPALMDWIVHSYFSRK